LAWNEVLAKALTFLISRGVSLTKLSVSGVLRLDYLLENTQSELPPVKYLQYDSGYSPNEGVAPFLHLRSLEQLVLVGSCDPVKEAGWDFPNRATHMQSLEMTNTLIREGLIYIVKTCLSLIRLKVEFDVTYKDNFDYHFVQDVLDKCSDLVYAYFDVSST
jgi:hypothetical protein